MAEINIEKMVQDVAQRAVQELRDNGVFVGSWIPCSERLPEKAGRYLTTEKKNGYGVTINIFIWSDGDYPSWLYNNGVIAWMPLPKPYEKGGGSNDGSF